MQPLKTRSKATSPIEASAIALLRSVERYQPPLGQKQRVRMRLLETPHLQRRYLHISSPAFLVGAILVAAGASAALGGTWLSHKRTGASTESRSAPGAPVDRVNSLQKPKRVAESTVAVVSSVQAAPSPAASSASPASRVEPMQPHSEGPARPAASSEQGLVFDAMRALRREGQPERAARLLDDYLRRYPKGTLSEEALALAIEANSALGDPRARALAERYLSSYPEGRFRSAALRARARFSP